ncbi:hypothetical protein E4K10_49910 [Streptomyces sp. T1317-0309]|nr:hypothetical protein E4K10_49910 [Streptomyces sp. T1317-0309]
MATDPLVGVDPRTPALGQLGEPVARRARLGPGGRVRLRRALDGVSDRGGFGQGTVDAPVIGRVKKRYIFIPAGIAAAYVGWKWYQASRTPGRRPRTARTPPRSDRYRSEHLGCGGGDITGNNGSQTTDGTNGMSTNADWTNKAIELLTNQGYDGATVAAALGDFLAHQALDKNEASIARAALGVAGQPPVVARGRSRNRPRRTPAPCRPPRTCGPGTRLRTR